jgi:hypothetical protein
MNEDICQTIKNKLIHYEKLTYSEYDHCINCPTCGKWIETRALKKDKKEHLIYSNFRKKLRAMQKQGEIKSPREPQLNLQQKNK